MKLFAILLCIAIGSVFGELERREFGKEKLEVTEDINETRTLFSLDDGKTPYSSVENRRVKYALDNSFDQIPANAKDADSVEKETERNHSSVIETSTVKPSSSKAKKKNLEITYSGKPAKYIKMLREITKPKDTRSEREKKTLNDFFKSFLKDMDALSRKETNLVSKSGTVLRRKRGIKEIKIEDPTNMIESLKAYRKQRDKLPLSLRQRIQITDRLELKLIKYFAEHSDRAPKDLMIPYEGSIGEEKSILNDFVANRPMPENEAWEMVSNYKALRRGGRPMWNFIALRPSLQKFFKDDSTRGFAQYVVAKDDEQQNTNEYDFAGRDWSQAKDDGWALNSNAVYGSLIHALLAPLGDQINPTDQRETKMLEHCERDKKIPKDAIDAYYEERKKEIELYKKQLDRIGGLKKKSIIQAYHALRKGTIWNWMRYEHERVFENNLPCLPQYEAIKKEEVYTDQYVDGSMKIGEVPKKDEYTKAEAIERASSQSERENAKRMVRAKVGERAQAEEDEKAEEMERRVRATETETVEVEYDAYRENVENVVVTSVDAKGDAELHGSSANVTSTDVTNTETTTDTKAKDNGYLLRFVILFAVITQVIIAILILAPQRDEIAKWCKRIKRTESGHAETEPLKAGEKVLATGPVSKSSKSPLNTV